MKRRRGVLGCLVPLAVAVLLAAAILPPVLSPATSDRVASICTDTQSHLPASRMVRLRNGSSAFVVLRNHGSSLLLRADYGHTPFQAEVVLVDSSGVTRASLTFPNDVIAAGVSGSTLLLYNQGLLYKFSLKNDRSINTIVFIDNYREDPIYTDGNATYIQTNVSFSAIAPGGQLTINEHLALAVVAQGCWFPAHS